MTFPESFGELDALHAEIASLRSEAVQLREKLKISEGKIFSSEITTALALERAKRAEYRADHDELTGMPNRAAMMRRIGEKISQGRAFGVLFIDLDKFKHINDTEGHKAGDETLCHVSRKLTEMFKRENDEISHESQYKNSDVYSGMSGRYGGDEFIVVLGLTGDERRASEPSTEMEHVLEYTRKCFKNFGIQAAIGGAVWLPNNSSNDVSELVKRADDAMYHNKTTGELTLR